MKVPQIATLKKTAVPALAVIALANLTSGATAGAKSGSLLAKQAAQAGYVVKLSSRHIALEAGRFELRRIASTADSPTGRVHFMLQFRRLPTAREHRMIARDGVSLLGYLGWFTYVASVPKAWLSAVPALPQVRSATPFLTKDKIAPALRSGRFPPSARTQNGGIFLRVRLFDDIPVSAGVALVRSLGGKVVDVSTFVRTVTARFGSKSAMRRLARHDRVQYIDAPALPQSVEGLSSSAATGAPAVWAAPNGLTGVGQTVFVFDAGVVDGRHTDFGGRVADNPVPGTCTLVISFCADAVYGDHATHVGGIIGGSGINSNGPVIGGSTTLAFGTVALTTGPLVTNSLLLSPPLSRQPGDTILVGTGPNADTAVIAAWNGGSAPVGTSAFTGYTVTAPLAHAHNAGDPVQILNTGTAAGQYAGIAPGANIYSETGVGATLGEVPTAFQRALAAGASVANKSFGTTSAACATNGEYDATNELYDKIVLGMAGRPISLTISAGNKRPNNANLGCVNYGTLTASNHGKNNITVGNINGDDGTMTLTSSWGPTQDGRVKPDIAAPGCTSGNEPGASSAGNGRGIIAPDFRDLYQPDDPASPNPNGHWDDWIVSPATVTVAEPRDTYAWLCGTSMAAPAVAGSIALIDQDWAKIHPGDTPSPATVKAILIHTASRPQNGPVQAAPVGALTYPIPGAGAPWNWPNFVEGFGQLNLGAAINLVNKDKTEDWVKTDTFPAGPPVPPKVYTFNSDGSTDVTATLVWDDPPKPPATPPTGPAARQLVNQLNITLTDPDGAAWQPWVANPVTPAAASTRTVDALNNVQLVVAPKKAGIWKATVTGTTISNAAGQMFTVITPPTLASVSVSDAVANEGDPGTTNTAVFTISRSATLDRPQSVDYSISGGSASPGTDFVSTSGTAVIPAGQLATTVSVPVIGNTVAETPPDRSFTITISNPQPDQPITRAAGTGTVLDDDQGIQADVIAKTGDAVAGQTITNVQPNVSINKKSRVGVAADVSNGGTGLFIGNATDPLRLINPSWTTRRFDAAIQLNDTDQLIAKDVVPGSPPITHIRLWDGTTTDSYTRIATGGGFTSSYDAVVIPGVNNNNTYFHLGLSGSQWSIVTSAGASEGFNAVLRPWITDDNHIVARAGDFTGDSTNPPSPIVLWDTSFSSATTIACSGGCINPGFTQLGRAPAASEDSQVVTFYGTYTSPNVNIPQGPGIYASIDSTGSGRRLVRVATVGDSGIASFEPNTRVAVNSTQNSQHSVTVVYLAYDATGNKGVYTSAIRFLPAPNQPFDPANPDSFKVDAPRRIVSVGDRIRGVGPVYDLNVWDSVNDHASGDLAFWVQSGSINAAVRLRAQETPVLFVPGVAGSKLVQVDLANVMSDQQVWLPSLFPCLTCDWDRFLRTHLSLWPQDTSVTKSVRPTDVVQFRGAMASVFGSNYATLLDLLTTNGYTQYKLGTHGDNVDTCDRTQESDHPNLFVFPYDWRLSNTVNAGRLNSYMACIQKFYPGEKVNVITHSMGGLLTRRTILAFPSFAEKVNSLTSVTPPWLGAPKLQYVMLTGDFIPGAVSGPGVLHAVQSLPGPQELMPSEAYYNKVAPNFPLGEAGRNIDGDVPPTDPSNTELFDYQKMLKVMNAHDPDFKPGTTSHSFHSYTNAAGAGQDDWSHDPFKFPFYEFYGVQKTNKTIGQTLATTRPLCTVATNAEGKQLNNCDGDDSFVINFVSGDGTVPDVSADSVNVSGSPASPHTVTRVAEAGSTFDGNANFFEHTNILQNPDVQTKLLTILQDNGGPPAPARVLSLLRARSARATGPSSDSPANEENVSVYGIDSVIVSDSAGNSTAQVTVDGEQYPGSVPNVDTYAIGSRARLIRSFSSLPLTTTFVAAGGPVEIDVVDGPAGARTQATRYMDVSIPAGATVQLTSGTGTVPQLAYDSNGVHTTVPPTVAVTGAAAQDVTPPALSITRNRHDGFADVTINATDAGAGVADVWYSLDGTKFFKYTAPVTIDPSQVQSLYAYANDNAGNRSGAARFKVGELQVDQPTALDASASTDENQVVQIQLGGYSPSGEPLRYSAGQAANGTVSLTGSTLTYRPKQYFYGSDSFMFTVDDGYLTSMPALVTISVRHVNQTPIVTLTAPQNLNEGASPAPITATVFDPDGDALTLEWRASAGSVTATGATSGVGNVATSATFSAGDGPATVTVSLIATDNASAAGTGQAVIVVNNLPPGVSAGLPQSQFWGLPVTFLASATDPSPVDQAAGLVSSWSFGDGQSASGASALHAYAKPGSYSAKFSATDKDAATGSASVGVTISKRSGALAYTGAPSAPYGFLTLQARLSDSVDKASAQLAGHAIVFMLGTQSFVGKTDANGLASVTPSPIAPGSYALVVSLATDPLYSAAAVRTNVTVTRSLGRLSGTGLAFASGGSGSLSVTSTSLGVTGTLSYASPSLSLSATLLGPLGIRSDWHAAWLNGVDTTGRKLVVYAEDNGPGTSDVYKLWVNGALVTGTGALTTGDVAIGP